jgi:hypothetical protein
MRASTPPRSWLSESEITGRWRPGARTVWNGRVASPDGDMRASVPSCPVAGTRHWIRLRVSREDGAGAPDGYRGDDDDAVAMFVGAYMAISGLVRLLT